MRSHVVVLVMFWSLSSLLAAPQLPGEPRLLHAAPAAAPAPSLKYRLLPAPTELVPGNSVTFYYRSLTHLAEAPRNFLDLFRGGLQKDDKGEEYYQVDRWLDMPVKDLPQDQVAAYLNMFKNSYLKELELACHRLHCDWEWHGRNDRLLALLPEVQSFRHLGRIVALKARLLTAQGDVEQAIKTLQINFGLARDLCRGPTTIHALVGIAIAQFSLDEIEKLMQQSRVPNLYWALSTLPRPFADLRDAVAHEPASVFALLPTLKELEKGPASAEVMSALQADRKSFRDKLDIKKGFPEPLMVEGILPEARAYLLENGLKPDVLDKMPKQQIVLVYAMRRHQLAHEELSKWLRLPFAQAYQHMLKDLPVYQESCARLDVLLFDSVLERLSYYSSFEPAWFAAARLDRRIAALQALEAIRLQAASEKGKMPASLKEVTIAPVPLDPISGAPFLYKLEGNTGTLSALVPKGLEDRKNMALTYQLHLSDR